MNDHIRSRLSLLLGFEETCIIGLSIKIDLYILYQKIDVL